MSLVGTLAKMALGAAIAKGVSSMSKGAARQRPASNPGSGSIFGSDHSPEGGLGDLLENLTGGSARTSQSSGQGSGGGLSDILGGLVNPGTGSQSGRGAAGPGGDLMEMLGGMLGGARAGGGTAGGGLGGLLESLSGGGEPERGPASPAPGSLGDVLNDAFQHGGAPQSTPTKEQEDQAAVLLRAIVQAAKCDGRIDEREKDALMQHLGDISPDEAEVVNDAFRRPVSVDGLVRDVPRGMEAQVYAMSLVGLDLDSQAEAKYLHELGQALGIDARTANAIHQRMGEPALYS
ncbi:tellurite resistance TerB family protein [Aliiroseovarius sp. S2029]|uniref:DUF533 domain-containing protein n=1 Tax=Aliiroseovarius sp. S2029 TaxID=2936988 RepID=UPI0020C06852|nr:DUF533 domain-containing protein [Aliiroseovarius sp. S2029]MCK8483208.1 tellurite resistance TerB family protein [Aliiroseovarius sp. S2029]